VLDEAEDSTIASTSKSSLYFGRSSKFFCKSLKDLRFFKPLRANFDRDFGWIEAIGGHPGDWREQTLGLRLDAVHWLCHEKVH
jgi:hypothetical protein